MCPTTLASVGTTTQAQAQAKLAKKNAIFAILMLK